MPPPVITRTRNEIIEELYRSKQFNRCIGLMEPAHLRDDLKSEAIQVLLTQPPGRIEKMDRDGKLVAFAVRVVLNMMKSGRSTFAYLYREQFTDHIPELPVEEVNGRAAKEAEEEPLYEMLLRIRRLASQKHPEYIVELFTKGIKWYNQYMLSLYMEVGSYRVMERETGIPWESCYSTVKETMNQLKLLYAHPRTRATVSFPLDLVRNSGDSK
jgi:hypothetical protein